jgi:hypothetical protein
MRSAAAKIADYAREKLDGVEVVSISPLIAAERTMRLTLSCSTSRRTHSWPKPTWAELSDRATATCWHALMFATAA